ncbi:hypothetical protein BH79_32680 [Pseudomonas aeruginosa C0324C]|nr:hypothetical protein BH79_32680 [Pseudomonas aeruginosa C0324C]
MKGLTRSRPGDGVRALQAKVEGAAEEYRQLAVQHHRVDRRQLGRQAVPFLGPGQVLAMDDPLAGIASRL